MRCRFGRWIAATVLAVVVALPAGAPAASPPPYKPSGHFQLSNVGLTNEIKAKFIGTLPNLKNGEWVNYYATYMGSPPAGKCNTIAIDTVGLSKPKHTVTKWRPDIGMDWYVNETPQWCAGPWYAQAFVMTKKNGAYHGRLVFARKSFNIG